APWPARGALRDRARQPGRHLPEPDRAHAARLIQRLIHQGDRMTAFLALVRKDLILYLSDRRALLMHLVLPIVIAAFFGSVFGGSTRAGGIDVAVVQQDTSAVSAKIVAGL